MLNYYQILEIDSSATAVDIKKAYRRLVFKYHPDSNGNAETTSQFNLITEAYQTLIDVELRKNYDIKLFYGFETNSKNKSSNEDIKNNYKKYGNSSRNPTANSQKFNYKKNKEVKIPAFELFMYRVLLSFGILGFINSIRDLFIKEWDGVNSFTGFFFSTIFTTLLVVSWKNYKSGDD